MAPAAATVPVTSQPAPTPEADQQCFFRALGVRKSEASNSDTSPPVSPMTVVTQPHGRKVDKGRPQASLSEHSALAYEGIATTLLAHRIPVSGASIADPIILRAKASLDSLSSQQVASTDASFVGSFAEEFAKKPPLRGTLYATRGGSSPTETGPDIVSRMERSGNRLETSTWEDSHVARADTRPWDRPSSASEAMRFMRHTYGPKDSSGGWGTALIPDYKKDSGESDADRHRHEIPELQVPVVKLGMEGLYRRTKRYLGLKRRPVSKSELDLLDPATETDDMLNGVSNVLKDQQEKILIAFDGRSSGSSLSTTAKMSRPPRILPSSHKAGVSNSSSFPDGCMSKPPQNTRGPATLYRGSDDKEYFKVELSAPNAPTFLPSEATKISTPPSTPSGTKTGKCWGLFFALDAVSEGENLPRRQADIDKPKVIPTDGDTDADTVSNWFRVSVGFETLDDQFQLQVPEHLPNSPLCPRHPKHKSGGTGICVYHGRRRGSSETC
ncbi:accessory factor associated with RNA polymerase II [Hypocenomyce scalaris]|nr:accessory factor associated with RNA polymerase II [Hypocenomyce scalaris]